MTVETKTAMDRVVSLIMQSDGRWQWDDENNTDLPIATTSLVSGQQDYTMSVSHLQITRVEVKDNAATPNWHKLQPIDQVDVYDTSLTDYLNTNGLPKYYDKIGNSFFLYPAPDYAQSASLKIWFKRGQFSYFDYATNKFADGSGSASSTPGFNALYHELIPLWNAYNFAIANGKSNANAIMAQITLKEDALKDDYSVRSKDEHISLQARPMSWI